jgi:hypothetical protein
LTGEEFQKSQKYLGKLGMAGERGFNAIKVLRQDLAEYHYNRLTDAEKNDPAAIKAIAQLVNNATNATNLNIPSWVNEVTFAGGMEAARWGKLTTNPAKATGTALKAIFAPKSVSVQDRVFAKVWASRVGQQLATMTAMLAVNAAIQNIAYPNNPVNMTDPSKSDFLKFKFGSMTVDPTSGMRAAFMFIYGIGRIPFLDKQERRGDTVLESAGKKTFGYGRGKLAPAYSTVMDFYTKSDFNNNPLPFNDEKPRRGAHKLTWGEYAWQKAPLPVAEAAHVMYQSAIDHGADSKTLNHILDGIISGGISGTTGFRVGEHNAELSNIEAPKSPVTEYLDKKGMKMPNPNTSIIDVPILNEDGNSIGKKPLTDKEQRDYKEEWYKQYSEIFQRRIVDAPEDTWSGTTSDGVFFYGVKSKDLSKEQLKVISSKISGWATDATKNKILK